MLNLRRVAVQNVFSRNLSIQSRKIVQKKGKLTGEESALALFAGVEVRGGMPTVADSPNVLTRQSKALCSVNFSLNPVEGSSSARTGLDVRPLILYEDNHLLLMFKPNEVNVNADGGDVDEVLSSLLGASKKYLVHDRVSKNAWLNPCHFIDKPASGILVTAKSTKCAQRMAQLFRQRGRAMQKEYLTVVTGHVSATASEDGGEEQEVVLRHKVRNATGDEARRMRRRLFVTGELDERRPSLHGKGEGARMKRKDKVKETDKEALLAYKVLRHFRAPKDGRALSLLRVRLITGRKHQIRAQLAHIGHPIDMDTQYGTSDDPRGKIPQRIALHAFALEFPHPVKQPDETAYRSRIQVTCNVPDFWRSAYGSQVTEAVEMILHEISAASTADADDNDDVTS